MDSFMHPTHDIRARIESDNARLQRVRVVSIQFGEFFRGLRAVRVRAAVEKMFRSIKCIQDLATALELVRGQRFVLHFFKGLERPGFFLSLLLYRDTHNGWFFIYIRV